MNYVRKARADGYLDGLEQRPKRGGTYNVRAEAVAYQAGYDDGVIAREKMREDLRSTARKLFDTKGEFAGIEKAMGDIPEWARREEEARNPGYAGTVTGRWKGRRLTAHYPSFSAPYGIRRVMVAGDIAGGTDAMEDFPANGWLWVSVYERMAAAMKPISGGEAAAIVEKYRETFPLEKAMNDIPEWARREDDWLRWGGHDYVSPPTDRGACAVCGREATAIVHKRPTEGGRYQKD